METNRKGDLAEIKAVAWLWEQGYEVFRNVGCTGVLDLVAIKDGEILLIDVKTTTWNGEGWAHSYLNRKKVLALGGKILYYVEGQGFSFSRAAFNQPNEETKA